MASTNGISGDYYLSNFQKPQKQTGSSELGKDAFLKLLITQLQNQDPTKPMDDKEFIAQMAQFSSLEQMQNMTTAMGNLLEMQKQSQLMDYKSFIGNEVEWHELTEELDDEGNYIVNEGTGIVEQLRFVDGNPVFVLEDGTEINPGNISSVFNSSNSTSSNNGIAENPLVQASRLIGQTVNYEVDGEFIEAVIESVSTNNTLIEYMLSNGNRLTKEQFTLVNE